MDDGLPQFICSTCIYKCLMWDNFKKLCSNSDNTLRRLFKLPDKTSNLIVLLEKEIISNTALEESNTIDITVVETDENYLHITPESEDEINETGNKFVKDSEPEQINEVEKNQIDERTISKSKNKCNECRKSFRNSARYDAHLRMHKGLNVKNGKSFLCCYLIATF